MKSAKGPALSATTRGMKGTNRLVTFDNLARTLSRTAAQAPDKGIGYIQKDGRTVFQTYPELLESAHRVAGGLKRAGLKTGDKLVLALSVNEEFVPAFWGCILAGMVPVPVPAAASFAGAGVMEKRLAGVWEFLKKPPLLVSSRESFLSQDAAGAFDGIADSLLSFPEVSAHPPLSNFYDADPGEVAFIQFSSGSTGRPKGVCLTHANILANVRAIEAGLAMNGRDITLSWMPLYHDMGLIGFHLVPLHFGIDQFLIPTGDFLRRPLRWLESLARKRATITAAPNFSQTLVLKHLERGKAGARDLSRVRLVLNGAEPISAGLMTRFMAAMAGFGMGQAAMLPVYGLAEATLAVAFAPLEERPGIERVDRQQMQHHARAVPAAGAAQADAMELVHVGRPLKCCEIRIVDDGDQTLAEGCIGHIQVRGGNVCAGYWNDPGATRDAFCRDWLRTGDMGFVRQDSLVVTGRAKDVLFVNGQNFFAADLEGAAEAVDGVQAGKVAICASFDPSRGRDRVVVFLKSRGADKDIPLFSRVKEQLQRTAGVRVDAMVPLESSRFPRTTSGKLQRFELRRQFEAGLFHEAATKMAERMAEKEADADKAPPRTVHEKIVHRLWCRELGLPPEAVGIHDHFADLGGESIHAASFLALLEARHGIRLCSGDLAGRPTIAAIAAYLDQTATVSAAVGAKSARRRRFGG